MQQKQIRVSVCVPVTLTLTVECVPGDEDVDVEIICIDDVSHTLSVRALNEHLTDAEFDEIYRKARKV